ncbi:MAG: prolipoprotein diacylglyceryl transferase [Candidatus Saelkia tenebricola]|nr:prolipoprotein diacylglyceryl transferase [Candidatus Saelkia tenebricola]
MYPVLFQIGNLAVRTYGVVLVAVFFMCLYLLKYDAKRSSVTKETVERMSNYLLLGGFIGARIYYALFYDAFYYFTKPWTLLFVWEGGLAIHGAIIGGLIGLYLLAKKDKIKFLILANLIAPILLLGQAVGRLGCFLNGCCYGLPANIPWGVIFPKDSLAYYQFGFQALHPTQFYELVLNLSGFVVFWVIRKNIPQYLFSLYLMYYGLVRFIVSFFRADSLLFWGTDLRIAHIMSAVFILSGMFLFKYNRSHSKYPA